MHLRCSSFITESKPSLRKEDVLIKDDIQELPCVVRLARRCVYCSLQAEKAGDIYSKLSAQQTVHSSVKLMPVQLISDYPT
jgi:hypothetical protein